MAKVTLQETIDIPPNSVVRVSCEKPNDWNCYVIEQTKESNLLMPRGYYDSGTDPIVSLLNMTDRVVKLNKGECIGEATEAEHLDDAGIPSVYQKPQRKVTRPIKSYHNTCSNYMKNPVNIC